MYEQSHIAKNENKNAFLQNTHIRSKKENYQCKQQKDIFSENVPIKNLSSYKKHLENENKSLTVRKSIKNKKNESENKILRKEEIVSNLCKKDERNPKENLNNLSNLESEILEINENNLRSAYFINMFFRENIINNIAALIIDTGSELSLIKENAIISKECLAENIIQLKGINEIIVFTLGTIKLNIQIRNKIIPHHFHVVPRSFPISQDGILGRDILQRHNSIIDYNKETLTIFSETVKLLPPKYSVTLLARSETIIRIPCNKFKEGSCVYYETFQIKENVIMGSCLSVVNNKECIALILNSSEEDIQFESFEPPLILYEEDANILMMSSSLENNQKSNYTDRISDLKNCFDAS